MKKTLYKRDLGKSVNYSAEMPASKEQQIIICSLIMGFIVLVALGLFFFFNSKIILGVVSIVCALASFAGVFLYTFSLFKDSPDTKVTVTKVDTDYTYNGITNETIDNTVVRTEQKKIEDFLQK